MPDVAALIAALPAPVIVADATGTVVAANDVADGMFGYAAGALIGVTIETLMPMRFRERHVERRAEFGEHPSPRRLGERLNLRGLRRDGSEFALDVGLSSVATPDGDLTICCMNDLTARLEVLEALRSSERNHRESEQRYRQIFEGNAAVKILVDPESGAIVDANRAACEFYGRPHSELTGMTVFDLNPAPRDFIRQQLARSVAQANSYFQFQHRVASGELRDVEIYTGPMNIGGRQLICSVIHDISERKRSETLLESGRRLFEMIATGAPLTNVLDTVVQRLELQAPGALCSVLLLSEDGSRLIHASAPSLPEAYSRAIDGVAIGPNVGSCGAAAHRGETVIVTDIAVDPLWNGFRSVALNHGLRSCWSTPIRSIEGAVLGTFAVYYTEPRAPDDRELRLIEMATHVAGVAIARERSEQALRNRNQALEELYRQLTVTHADLAESNARLEEKSALLERGLAYERERARRDPLTGALNHAAITGELRDLIAVPDGPTVAVATLDVDGLKVANDTYGHQVGDAVLVKIAEALRRDDAIVGRYGGDEFVAILRGADRSAAEQYADDVLAALANAALCDPATGARVPIVASIGLAIYPQEAEAVDDLIRLSDHAMYAARRQRAADASGAVLNRTLGGDRAAKMVGEIVPLLTSPGDVGSKLRLVAHRLSVGAGYDAVNFVMESVDRPGIDSTAFARVRESWLEAWNALASSAPNRTISSILLRTRQPIIVDDLTRDRRLDEKQRSMLAAARLQSGLIAPMWWDGRLVGVLSVGSKRTSAFSLRDVEFVGAVATQVSAIVRMSALVEELRTSSARLMGAHADTVMMLARAAEAHDQMTGRHLQRVSSLAEAIALQLGYDAGAAKELGLAAVLHDIGKIRVPDMVLGSSSTLAESEWVLMKQHTIWGSEFLAGQQGFELAAAVARSHHERWDGSGYPAGIAGDAIPEAAQITAVADAFDAMTNDRPYRTGRPPEDAIREIVACAGTQFSPRIADALARVWERNAMPFLDARDEDEAASQAA